MPRAASRPLARRSCQTLGVMTHPPIVGTAAITLEGVSIAPAAPPHTYLGMSRQFANAIRPLAAAGPPCAVPLAFVCAQTLECALKAYLSRAGNDARLRQSPLRHNLEQLWLLAESEHLSLPSPVPAWVPRLSSLHDRPYYLRYSTGVHAMVSPGAEPMCSDIERVVALIVQSI